jgi:hypothetical protein
VGAKSLGVLTHTKKKTTTTTTKHNDTALCIYY